MTAIVAPPRKRWCVRCREQFNTDPRYPAAKICVDCRNGHPDARVRHLHRQGRR